MKLKNSLFDDLVHNDDGQYYAVNLWLKSGETIYLEDLSKGEKEAYLQYVRAGNQIMLISSPSTIWRLTPEDIVRVDVKMYGLANQKTVYPLFRIFLAKSRIATETFSNFIRLYLLVLMAIILAGVVKVFKDGDLMGLLFDTTILANYVATVISWMEAGFLVVFGIMIIANFVDFILKPMQTYHVIDPDRHILYGTKTAHLLMSFAFAVGFIVLKAIMLFGLSLLS